MNDTDSSDMPTQQTGIVKQTTSVGIHFSGPLPDAGSFKEYEATLPGAGNAF